MISSTMMNELLTITVMAFALGMDAFSVGMGMGMIELRLKQIAKIGLIIGLFHAIMPLLGMGVGSLLSSHFGSLAGFAGGILLLLLGAQMIFSAFQKEEEPVVQPIGIGLIIFAISVSLDSFSVGLSLGIFGAKGIVTVLIFGGVSMALTWAGLLLGRNFQKFLGKYSVVLGGCILFTFGIKLLMTH